MPLEVIGAGLGRTGTKSLQTALQILGFGPCYHMDEAERRPEHDALWLSTVRGETTAWNELFDSYQATVDWPGAAYYRELAEYYPRAKVILSVRDPHAWAVSMSKTVIPAVSSPPPPSIRYAHRKMTRMLIYEEVLGQNGEDLTFLSELFSRHNTQVSETIPAERLLTFEASSGWEPLCAFLECEIPKVPYPSRNSAAEFNAIPRSL